MDKRYQPEQIEKDCYQAWEAGNYFAPKGNGDPYCIMLPPPNVTGDLHMGHAFQQTLMDILIRYHRMCGDKTLWQCGTDHAGIATQMVVERQLDAQGTSRHTLGREAFIEKVWQWKGRSGSNITRQSRHLGTSMDWSRECFTLDESLSEAVTEVFLRLYQEGLIYRGKRLVNWDPSLQTAVSDLEVITVESSSHLWHIRYPLVQPTDNNLKALVVATTRPETLLGDAAVAVHPEDERYRSLIGQQVLLPLCQRAIPIIADDYVSPEFGSGCVKITPAHDFNDYAVGQRHNLPLVNIFTPDAHLNDEVPTIYRGLERYVARKKIVADLKEAGLLEKVEPRTAMVPRGDRTNTVLEPYLTDQWYVRTKPLAEPAMQAVSEGHIRFVPENWSKTYFNWMNNIEDWCISRQLWWGHRIPAWYDESGNIYVGRSEAVVRSQYDIQADVLLRQDPDVLDTWFSSALWPFSTLGWPKKDDELKQFYPSAVLVTGFDIIFFWVARMIMMGLKFLGEIPFKEVYIHGLIRDAEGQKMSKSKGNILDPLDLIHGIDLEALIKKRTTGLMLPNWAPKIERATRKHFPNGINAYGTDALRFTFAILATQGREINFDVNRLQGYRNFCNKLWNAARFILLNLEGLDKLKTNVDLREEKLGCTDYWICAQLSLTITKVTQEFNQYRFDLAAQNIYEFIWNEYCDWYMEFSKVTLHSSSATEDEKRIISQTLVMTFEILLRLIHPIMPFISEVLWKKIIPFVGKTDKTIMLQAYPVSSDVPYNEAVFPKIGWLKQFISGIRKIRSEKDIPPAKLLTVQYQGGNNKERGWLEENIHDIKTLAKIKTITEVVTAPKDAIIILAGQMSVLVDLAELIDLRKESTRLTKNLEAEQKQIKQLIDKLANNNFITHAPTDVVEKSRQKLADLKVSARKLEEQYQHIKTLLERNK